MPTQDIQTGEPGFLDRGQIRELRQAFTADDGQPIDFFGEQKTSRFAVLHSNFLDAPIPAHYTH
jgi:hypothetical protein